MKNYKEACIRYLLFINILIMSTDIMGSLTNKKQQSNKVEYVEELSLEQMKDLILSSSLTNEEKEILCNDDYINDVIDIINDDETRRSEIYYLYTNLNVNYEEIQEEGLKGYVYHNDSTIHMDNELKQEELNNENVLTHEFIHINQKSERNILTEATAEILSSEYYNSPEESYYYEIKATELLMEIIGPEPIIQYIYYNDKTLIQDNIKPYLDDNQYNLFEEYYFNTYNESTDVLSRTTYYKIVDILSEVHNNKYKKNMVDNPMINAILNGTLYDRYYFNEREMDEHSCYYSKEKIKMSLQEALEQGYVKTTMLTVVSDNEDGTLYKREQLYYVPLDSNSYIVNDTAYIYDLSPKEVEPINQTFKKQLKKSN